MTKREAAKHEGLWEWPNESRVTITWNTKQKQFRFEWVDGTGGIWVEPEDIWEYRRGLIRIKEEEIKT